MQIHCNSYPASQMCFKYKINELQISVGFYLAKLTHFTEKK